MGGLLDAGRLFIYKDMNEQEAYAELARLMSDREWRLDNLYAIHNKQGKLIRFIRNDSQRKLSRRRHKRKNILKARQLGISTYIAILMLDACLFAGNTPQTCAIVDKRQRDADKKIKKIVTAYDALDVALEDTPYAQAVARIGKMLKDSVKMNPKTESVEFDNGSSVTASVSARGDTLQWLHVSELGYTSIHSPAKAAEIVSGTINAVAQGCHVYLESTHKGGRHGQNYELLKAAMSLIGQELNPIEFEFHFFPWHTQPEYRIKGGVPRLTAKLVEYFGELETKGIKLDVEQKAWYCSMCATQPLGLMKQEYPSTPDECFNNVVAGSIYAAQVALAETEGRFYRILHDDKTAPLYVVMDLGMSDAFTMWLIQPREDGYYYAVNYFACRGQVLSFYASKIREWERQYGQLMECCFLPHDAAQRSISSGLTVAQEFGKSGLPYKVLPRINDVWQGINWTRQIFDRFIFSADCDLPMAETPQGLLPAGLVSLRNYCTELMSDGESFQHKPSHKLYSDGADSFRYFAEALNRGYVGRAGNVRQATRNTVQVLSSADGGGDGW